MHSHLLWKQGSFSLKARCVHFVAEPIRGKRLFQRVGSGVVHQQAASQEEASVQVPVQEEAPPCVSENGATDSPEIVLSKAAARKARRVPPSPVCKGSLASKSTEDLQAAFSNGVLLVDKPIGWTSFDVCGKLRNTLKFLSIKKVGHAGTLDPMATGLLIVATGAGTKFCDDFMAQSKEYSGTIRLGEGTATYDAEAEVTERLPWEHITDDELTRAAAQFLGDIQQVPPMYSAIKVKGQKLYDLAREGTVIEREARPVTITQFKVWRDGSSSRGDGAGTGQGGCTSAGPVEGQRPNWWNQKMQLVGQANQDGAASPAASDLTNQASAEGPKHSQEVHFYVACSKGTYIRSLAYDLGRALGTVAHLTALRREAIGDMRVADAWPLQDLLQELYAARDMHLSKPKEQSIQA